MLEQRPLSKPAPYKHGAARAVKVFYITRKTKKLCRLYLLLLLTAETHGQAVPHCKRPSVYEQILHPGRPTGFKRRRLEVEKEDDWDNLVRPVPKRSGGARGRQRRRRSLSSSSNENGGGLEHDAASGEQQQREGGGVEFELVIELVVVEQQQQQQ